MRTADFFAANPVFSLDDAVRVLAPPGGRPGAVERLKHHLRSGRLRLATKGVYAVVPAGVAASGFRPDPFLVALAVRPDAVFCYHSALELLGTAQSAWTRCTLFTARRRRPVAIGRLAIQFLDDPSPLSDEPLRHLGTRRLERRGRLMEVTGPERTLVEGFRRSGLVGGVQELVDSASGTPALDISLLEEILRRYDVAKLWAAVGWFLERFQQTFHVSEAALRRAEGFRPRSPQYLVRTSRGGFLAARWNLILPEGTGKGEIDEP